MKKYPFKFLDAYERNDRNIFFGRDEEIEALYEMVFQSDLVLVYGASGTGKTSLINCGLAGKFQPHNWLPLTIRRGKDINTSLKDKLLEAGGNFDTAFQYSSDYGDLDEETHTRSPLGNALQSIYQHYFRPIYLIFDQFEELFIIGHKQEQQAFLEALEDMLSSGLPIKIIISIREEYLGYLFDFERKIPALLHKKLRVEPMNLDKVKQVIVGATAYENTNVTVKNGEAETLAEQIFEKLKDKKKSRTIQLPFLQVFLDKFYLEITKDKTRTAEAEFSLDALKKMGEIEDVLVDFLEEQVKILALDFKPKFPQINTVLVWKILSPFSTLDGTKEPMSKKELLTRLPDIESELIDALLLGFVNSRLLRFNEDSETYEISHDSLAKPIAEKRSLEENNLLEIRRLIKSQINVNEEAREYFTEKQLLFIEPYLHRFKLTTEEQSWIDKSKKTLKLRQQEQAEEEAAEIIKVKKARNLKRKYYATALLTLLFVGLSVWAILETFKAKKTQSKLSIKIKQNYSIQKILDEEIKFVNELIMEIMQGQGEQYQNLSSTELKDILEYERKTPLDSLIQVAGIEAMHNDYTDLKSYTLWIDMPSLRRHEIKQVNYKSCPSLINGTQTSNHRASFFTIGILGVEPFCDTVFVDIIKTNNDTLHITFPFKEYFESKKDSL